MSVRSSHFGSSLIFATSASVSLGDSLPHFGYKAGPASSLLAPTPCALAASSPDLSYSPTVCVFATTHHLRLPPGSAAGPENALLGHKTLRYLTAISCILSP
ncbi:hypothetical protein B5807_06288 [Epicoccum nigrum]|uniref:Uncharacterized protein n=1 Tax=Epicoccum nigrum TaxID=105696 RepID=A0A1Y2M1N2_EPING|nr:hypothetical protein B5807_06288 [Epicoccum nigrum]